MSAPVNDPLFPSQWYIRNTGQSGGTPGVDLNLGDVWKDYTGKGVVVGVFDQGIEFNHPDLARNVNPAISMSAQPVGDGEPLTSSDDHGMQVAGEIAAVPNNSIGLTGIAPNATLASVYLNLSGDDDGAPDNDYAAGFRQAAKYYDVANNSWGGDPTGFTNFSDPGSPADFEGGKALAEAAVTGRKGLGTVIVFSGGNDRLMGANANSENWTSSPYTIAVAAIGHHGRVASYSTPGANLLVGAPSIDIIYANVDTDHDGINDAGEGGGDPVDNPGPDPEDQFAQNTGSHDPEETPAGENDGPAQGEGDRRESAGTRAVTEIRREGGIVTTTLMGQGVTETGARGGDYDFTFGGTSAAAPEVSAVAALMLEANPRLGYRDVQDILAITARNSDKSAQWTINAATNWNGGGMHTNYDTGFGLVDAHAAVRLAETWTIQSTAANVVKVGGSAQVNRTVPEGGPGVSSSIQVTGKEQVERAEVILDAEHPYAKDLVVTLTAPSGTQSVLLTAPASIDPDGKQALSQPYPSQPFSMTSTRHLGESSQGTWTLTMQDTGANGRTGVFENWGIVLWGRDEKDKPPYVYTNEFDYYAAQDQRRKTLDDPSGNTVINASPVTSNSVVNANPGSVSRIDGVNLTLSPRTNVTAVYTGDGGDILIGSGNGGTLYAGRGNDILTPGPGPQVLDGGPGLDVAFFPNGLLDNDYVNTAKGNTVVTPLGADVVRNIDLLAFRDQIVPTASITFRDESLLAPRGGALAG
jgi:subtilisin-like proprotein convertase family protein